MIDERRKQEAKKNFDMYLRDGLLKKERHEEAKNKYIENASNRQCTTSISRRATLSARHSVRT